MPNPIYAKITTNRSMLMKYIDLFRRGKAPSESLIAPRPVPGKQQTRYYALVILEHNSEIHSFFTERGKLTIINKQQYQQEMAQIKYYWSA